MTFLNSGCKHDTKLILVSILTFSRSWKSNMLKQNMRLWRLTLKFKVTHINSMKNLISGIWTASVSDHLPIFLSLPHQILKQTPCDRTGNQTYLFKSKLRKFSEYNKGYRLVNSQDINDKYTCLSNIISDAHEKCFPLKSVKVNPMRDTKPWITTGILKSLKKKEWSIQAVHEYEKRRNIE